jgi:hypothetical protein
MEYRLQVGARWPFLSDPERTVQKDLGIQEYTNPKHDPMIPHTLVLEPGLVIYKIYNGYFFWGRPSNEDLWRDLREIFRKRPDYDPTAPGCARTGKRAIRASTTPTRHRRKEGERWTSDHRRAIT